MDNKRLYALFFNVIYIEENADCGDSLNDLYMTITKELVGIYDDKSKLPGLVNQKWEDVEPWKSGLIKEIPIYEKYYDLTEPEIGDHEEYLLRDNPFFINDPKTVINIKYGPKLFENYPGFYSLENIYVNKDFVPYGD